MFLLNWIKAMESPQNAIIKDDEIFVHQNIIILLSTFISFFLCVLPMNCRVLEASLVPVASPVCLVLLASLAVRAPWDLRVTMDPQASQDPQDSLDH